MTPDPRTPVFDAIKAGVPNVWNEPGNMHAMHNLLDAFGFPREAVAKDPFSRALVEVLTHEGGYVNDPRDSGGRTNLGVTQDTWEAWVGHPVTEADMRALTPSVVTPLYRKQYWEVSGCDDMPAGLAMCVFDFAVNAGPRRAVRYLQTMVGADVDGMWGPNTKDAAGRFVRSVGEAEAVRRYQEARRKYYRQLKQFSIYGRGWLRRVDAVESAALKVTK